MTSVTPSEEVRSLRAGSPLGPGDDNGQWERRLASTWRACNTTMPGEGVGEGGRGDTRIINYVAQWNFSDQDVLLTVHDFMRTVQNSHCIV